MLSKIIVTFLIVAMNGVDTIGAITGWNVCPVIDNLNEVAYAIENHISF